MKRTLYLFGATMTASIAITSCSTQDVPAKPKNYYGVDTGNDGVPKEAYYAFFAGVVVVILFSLWVLKKIKKR